MTAIGLNYFRMIHIGGNDLSVDQSPSFSDGSKLTFHVKIYLFGTSRNIHES